ncbi:MAG: outer membrane beta-barrel protein [Gelidibacter sp.]|nr:outer membrane beta-barrel protein [Gelidibacter sp.]
MKSKFKQYIVIILTLNFGLVSFSQSETQKIKAQIAVGVNSPSSGGFVSPFEAKPVNFPTVNLGIQYMFKEQLGVKLDYGFSRFSSADDSPEFKDNYSRVNAQFVFDATKTLAFLPQRIGVVGHAGPGYSFVKPLGDYVDNKLSFFNVMAGVEFHYGINERLSVFADASYIYGLAKDFDPMVEGYGSFNGNLFTLTFGVSFSLSGCQYC